MSSRIDVDGQVSSNIIITPEAPMRFEDFNFGSNCIDGAIYKRNVVIDRGEIHKRWKKASKKFKAE